MKKYTVYFEIYGKKLKATVSADNEDIAKKAIKNKIIFHKIEEVVDKTQQKTEDILSQFSDIFGTNFGSNK